MASKRPRQEVQALRVVRAYLAGWRTDEVSDVAVWLENEQPDTRLVVTFRHRDRPSGCTFGMRFHVEDLVTPADPEPSPTVVWANLDEQIDAADLGLPKDCRPGEVTWL